MTPRRRPRRICAPAPHAFAMRACSSRRRRRDRPLPVSYSRKVFIPITRLCRDKCHYCTFVTVPGKLRAQGKGMYLEPDEILDIARRGAALGCKEALFTLGDRPEDRWPEATAVARRARLRLDAGLRAGDRDQGARGDRAAAAPEPRRHDLGGAVPAQAGRAVDGHDAGDHLTAAVHRERAWPTTAAPTRTPTVRLRTLDRRGPPVDSVHDGPAGRHRRDAERSRRDDSCDPRAAQGVRARPGSDRSELPRQGPDTAMAVVPGRGHRGVPGDRRRHPAGAGPAMRIQAPPNLVSRSGLPGADRRGHRRLGRGVAADAGPREPGAAVAESGRSGRDHRGGRLPPGPATDRASEVRAGRRPAWIDPRIQRTSPRSPTRRPAWRSDVDPGRPSVAGARRGRPSRWAASI